jgi:hypothetical protein
MLFGIMLTESAHNASSLDPFSKKGMEKGNHLLKGAIAPLNAPLQADASLDWQIRLPFF